MDALRAWAEKKGPHRLADLARLVIRSSDVEFGRWAEVSRLRGDAAQGFEGDAVAGQVEGAEGLVEGDGSALRAGFAQEDARGKAGDLGSLGDGGEAGIHPTGFELGIPRLGDSEQFRNLRLAQFAPRSPSLHNPAE